MKKSWYTPEKVVFGLGQAEDGTPGVRGLPRNSICRIAAALPESNITSDSFN